MRAFSLVELSIVLVILGLLTGGILTGQSLIRAAELRAVSTEYQRYSAAVNTFRDKYLSIPGDFRDATKFWNLQSGASGCVSNSGKSAGSPGTCDGNGNGILNQAAAESETGEGFQFWRQLAFAGLVEGTYTGIAGSASHEDSTPGSNVPASKLGNAGWSAFNARNYDGDGSAFAYDYGNYLVIGAKDPDSKMQAAILRPEEAWNIDTKMDDGHPAQGTVVARFWNNQCTAPNTGAVARTNLDASYRLTDSSLRCALNFVRAF